ncbi:hypothetical protein [Kitasatospora purpeofusca]|uniref:Uncharacterized protein n=1 Tax=Kitasatospora purpeofusca TaxID=67352 RepID=A0ABZ1TSD2_9ACTN|nr:hypothetical protein [Kitasatospora purpeofusca]
MTFRRTVPAAAAAIVLVLGVGSQAAHGQSPRSAAPACQAWTKESAQDYLIRGDGFDHATQTVPKDTCLIKVDENRFPPGWYTGDVSQWRIAKEDSPGARYKQFVFAVVREEENGYQEAYVLDRDQLRDVAENVDCDARVTKDGAHSWRADIRIYGQPNMQFTGWIRTWNELEGFTDLGAYWRRNQCVKLTGSGTKWDGHTYYETPLGAGGGHYRWIRTDDIELLRP